VLVVDINTSRAALDASNRASFMERLANAARAVPGVTHAAASLNTPVNRGVTAVSDFAAPDGRELPRAERRAIVNLVTPGWFETYGMTLRAGRVINEGDTAGAGGVVVANEAFVQKFFPNGGAVGSIVYNVTAEPAETRTPLTVVGVVANAVDQSLRADAFPTLYQPLSQFSVPLPLVEMSLSVRAASGSPALLARSISAALTSVERNLSFTFHPLHEQVSAARQRERMVARLSGFFGVLALLLAGIGLHGVMSYAVERQRVEIGIRMALGARSNDIVTLTVRHTLIMTLYGVAAGLLVAAAVTRYLQTLLFGIKPLDPVTFVVAPAVLVAVALLACYLPTRRATSIDPMVALRSE